MSSALRSPCWRFGYQETEVERLMEGAIAKSERPWLILLSALATLIVVLLVLLGLRLEGHGIMTAFYQLTSIRMGD